MIFILLIPTVSFTINLTETRLQNHSRIQDELLWPSGDTRRSARQDSIPSQGQDLSLILNYNFFVLKNYTFLILTIYFAISVIDSILESHYRKPEEQPWFSGLRCRHDRKPTGSTPSFVFCSRLNFLITTHLFNNKHDTM